MRSLLFFSIAIAHLVACGQNEPLAIYQPKSAQEQALKSVLLAFENGVKNQDSQKIADLLHATASVMVGRERQMLNRNAYLKILPERLRDSPAASMGKPKMDIKGDQAEVKIYMKRGNNNTLVVFNFIREVNKWYIQSWQY
jgi:hypothetical protein